MRKQHQIGRRPYKLNIQMEKIITELMEQHKEIQAAIESLRKMQFNNNNKEAIEQFTLIKELILNHINTEDQFLYPVLEEKALKNNIIKSNLKIFAKEWNLFLNQTNRYFDKYSKSIDNTSFAEDTTKIIVALKQRILKEETILFKDYSAS